MGRLDCEAVTENNSFVIDSMTAIVHHNLSLRAVSLLYNVIFRRVMELEKAA